MSATSGWAVSPFAVRAAQRAEATLRAANELSVKKSQIVSVRASMLCCSGKQAENTLCAPPTSCQLSVNKSQIVCVRASKLCCSGKQAENTLCAPPTSCQLSVNKSQIVCVRASKLCCSGKQAENTLCAPRASAGWAVVTTGRRRQAWVNGHGSAGRAVNASVYNNGLLLLLLFIVGL